MITSKNLRTGPGTLYHRSFAKKLRAVISGLMFLAIIVPTGNCQAQTLFSYGPHTVSKSEFVHAYNKNNSDTGNPKIAVADYLDLYARFRMKVQAALDEKLDSSSAQKAEVKAFRGQLSEGFLKEDASIRLFVDEAANRAKNDIHLTDLYVAVKPGPTQAELSAARARIQEAYARLQKGQDFETVAKDFKYADFGFITVFVLPYAVENIAYTTPIGKYSKPYQNSQGFHIFRPAEERKAFGRLRVSQILLAFPPDADEATKTTVRTRADSVYSALKNGADFSDLAMRLSNDNLSYQTGGELPVFGIGQYDPAFEKAAFSLTHDGDMSAPVMTSFGYHIIKRLQAIPVPEAANDKLWRSWVKDQVEQSDRMKVAQQVLLANIRRAIKKDAPAIVQTSDTAALEYYRNHLEKYNADFASQLKEFTEGNLLFAMMQKKVWDAASDDSVGLLDYYNAHKDKYVWENSADALIITVMNKKMTDSVSSHVKEKFPQWKRWSDASNGLIQIDSGRYELSQIPVLERTHFTEGSLTAPVASSQDSSSSFAYIIKLYQGREPKKFEDAKSSVISDYQGFLENRWIAELKQKYPLKINQKVLSSITKSL